MKAKASMVFLVALGVACGLWLLALSIAEEQFDSWFFLVLGCTIINCFQLPHRINELLKGD